MIWKVEIRQAIDACGQDEWSAWADGKRIGAAKACGNRGRTVILPQWAVFPRGMTLEQWVETTAAHERVCLDQIWTTGRHSASD